MAEYDSWDFEPAPEPLDTWDSWDTPSTGPSNLDLPAPDFGGGPPFGCKGGFDDGKGGFNDFGGKGNFMPDFNSKGDFGKGNFGKGPMDFGKGFNDSKGCFDMGKGFDGGKSFGGGPGDFGKGLPDFGKGMPDFGKGGMDFGKGPPDFGKGSSDFNDFSKGGFGKGMDDFSKGFGKDFSKGGFDGGCGKGDFGCKGMESNNFSLKGAMGKNDFSDMGLQGCGPSKGSFDGKGVVVVPPPGGAVAGAAPKGQASGQFVPAPPVPLKGQKGFDGGKGFMGQKGMPGMKGGPGPGLQPFGGCGGCVPPPPPGGLAPFNGNLAPFAKAPQAGLAPELLALTEAENITLIDDGPGLQPQAPGLQPGVKKPRLFLLLTRLAPELQSDHMQQILEQCGEVQAFRRARDPNGKPLSFGFAQFADPEAAWKASTCISKLVLCGHEIKALLEEQTESVIDQWRKAQQAALKVTTPEELEWELERKSVICKSYVDAKVEEIYGPGKGGSAGSKRKEELRKKEQARVLRVRKRKAWREEQFGKELERVESLEKRLRREERARDGMDRKKEDLEKPKEKDEVTGEMRAKKEEFGDMGEAVGTLAVVGNDNRVLSDLVDRIQSEPRDHIFKMDLDVTHLRNEKTFEKKLRPWLDRKIDLFMGGPQSDLVEYVLRRVNAATPADALISDLSRYMDDNAEPLVERMWRMLIFELMRSGHPMDGRRMKEPAAGA